MCINWVDPVVFMYWNKIRQYKEARSYFNFGSMISIFSLALVSYAFLLLKSKGSFEISNIAKIGIQNCMLRNGHEPAKFDIRALEHGNFKSSMLPAIALGAYLGITHNASFHKYT